MLAITVKIYEELSTEELYGILQLRSAVFVVEQNCVYQDLDGKDKKALHVIGKKDNKVVAYTRIFAPGDYFEHASIGRVVVDKTQRKYGYGIQVMEASIKAIFDKLQETKIKLSAQTYLKNFYNELGFIETGKTYLEDGIPHMEMIKN